MSKSENQIVKLSSDSMLKILFRTISWFIVYLIFVYFKDLAIFNSNESYIFVVAYMGIASLIEIILREKNVLYKIKSVFWKGFLYFVTSFIIAFPILILSLFLFRGISLSAVYSFGATIFVPLAISYVGSKLKLL
jgi:hypothetical protein